MEKTKGKLLGVISKRILKKPKKIKKSNKNKLVNKVINYLKSDFYMFAPLLSSPPSDSSSTKTSSSTGVEEALKASEGKKLNLLDRVEKYLKSDVYMYAPLVDPRLSQVDFATSLKPGTKSVSPKKKFNEIEKPPEGVAKIPCEESAVVRQTITHRETMKHVIQRDCRSSTLPGKRALETRHRKLVE